ncbi:MAG: hypothetical protein ACRD2N_20215, partial [Vicinamibacterales bacterium]
GVVLLACGFGTSHARGCVLTVENPGIIGDHNVAGYWAIGAGADQAIASLIARNHGPHVDTSQTVYNVLEAKFSAECVFGVGRESLLMVLSRDGEIIGLSADNINTLRTEWERIGRPRPLSKKSYQMISASLDRSRKEQGSQSSSETSSSRDQT